MATQATQQRSNPSSLQPSWIELECRQLLAPRVKVLKKLGSGSFGEIYLGEMEDGNNVAIKGEAKTAATSQLHIEYNVYSKMLDCEGIPKIISFKEYKNISILIMELLGPSLDRLLAFCGGHFSLKTTLMIGDQMLRLVEYIHKKSIIHRDLKPENFLIGSGSKEGQIHIIDFGLSKHWCNPHSLEHIPYRDDKSLTGTARYASRNTHLGIEQSRRDDLECIGYVMLFFLRGNLPWQNLRANTKEEKCEKISYMKCVTSVETLCSGCPVEFVKYMNYVRGLRFTEKPDYSVLRKLFRDLFLRHGYRYDLVYDWDVKKQEAKDEKEKGKRGAERKQKEADHSGSPPLMDERLEAYISKKWPNRKKGLLLRAAGDRSS
eukprot:CAMPEP_0177634956 /NCGR_PEP_ID=MMETSP0447-20121125/3644_1 /TAXON_ID=0 /ORGANISM="Stygamoeba regulata, Strain BSH-02190019" /LENGTH=375 /DNA_ID=CAMNT_0019136711 /DNA_START=44 /DNA_END=1171 /DNA_ORIENTATION=-